MAAPSADPALIRALRTLLADTMVLYQRAHAAHWNVEGPLFPQAHDFFGEFYEDVFGAVDNIAEAIRQHLTAAPSTMPELIGPSELKPAPIRSTDPKVLLQDLLRLNEQYQDCLMEAFDAAEATPDMGLANYLQDRMGAHLKWDWKIRVQVKAAGGAATPPSPRGSSTPFDEESDAHEASESADFEAGEDEEMAEAAPPVKRAAPAAPKPAPPQMRSPFRGMPAIPVKRTTGKGR